ARVGDAIISHDAGDIYVDLGRPTPYPAGVLLGLRPLLPHGVLLCVALAGLALVASRLALRRRLDVSGHFKLSHLVPSLIQVTIFSYWALYWGNLRQHLPLIGVEIVFAYAVDALISLA